MADPGTATALIISSAVSSIQSAAQAKAQARQQRRQQEQQIAIREQERQVQESRQREQSKAQQARARAAFGARGVSSTGGSANALVDGIASRTEKAIAEDRRLFDLGVESLRANQRARERENLLATRNNIMSTVANTGGQMIARGISNSFSSGGNAPYETSTLSRQYTGSGWA